MSEKYIKIIQQNGRINILPGSVDVDKVDECMEIITATGEEIYDALVKVRDEVVVGERTIKNGKQN